MRYFFFLSWCLNKTCKLYIFTNVNSIFPYSRMKKTSQKYSENSRLGYGNNILYKNGLWSDVNLPPPPTLQKKRLNLRVLCMNIPTIFYVLDLYIPSCRLFRHILREIIWSFLLSSDWLSSLGQKFRSPPKISLLLGWYVSQCLSVLKDGCCTFQALDSIC